MTLHQGALLLGCALAACRQPGTSASLSEISAAPLGVQFGPTPLGLEVKKTLTLMNSGRTTLQVDALELTGTDAARFTVDPAGPLALVDPLTVHVRYTPTREGLDVAQLTVQSNASNTMSLQIALSGVGIVRDAGTSLLDGGTTPGDAGTTIPPARDAGFFTDESGCPPTWASGTEATTYQVNPGHTGAQPDDRLTLPLCQRWRRDLGGWASYAVAAQGLVYVATAGAQGRQLWALDQYSGATRWGPTSLGGTYSWLALALGDGAVYALSDSGILVAVDALTGQQRWIQQVGRTDSAPTAVPGGLFVSVQLAVRSLDPATGATRWSKPVINGDTSSPSVGADLVATSYACNQAFGFSLDGASRWHATSSCSGGGGKTTALHLGRVYTRDSGGNLVLDGANGALRGTYSSRFIPAFAGDLAITSAGTATQGLALANNQVRWTSEAVIAAPLVVGSHVVLPTGTGLVVLDAVTGVEVDRRPLADIRGTDEQNLSSPLAGLSAANGMLFVPAGTALVAY